MKHRLFAKPALFLSAAIVLVQYAAAAKDFILVKDGKPEAVIVRNAGASKLLDKHIQFFNTELKRCTKTVLPVVKTAGNDRNKIVFKLSKQPILKEDAFTIDFPDARTLRITGTETSVRWAFNHLLENDLGIRWLLPPLKGFYGPEINHYPQLKTAKVKAETFSDRPGVPVSRRPDWRIDGSNWNGKVGVANIHFTTIDVFPVYKYAVDSSWPKAILPVINGKKYVPPKAKAPLSPNPYLAMKDYSDRWQPCWSNPETTRIAIENILESLQKNPDKKIINMDVNDNGGCCECEACRKAVEGKVNLSGLVDYSELYWTWVNNVANAVTKKYPDVVFSAIAYREVLNPPSFKLHPNVLPRLCIELASMVEPRWYEKRIRLIKEWSDKSAMLDLYDYMHGLGRFLLPRIYFRSHSKILSELIRNYKLCSAYFESEGKTAFQGPLQSLMLKVLWNPDLDVEAFLKDWCEHAVGKKAAPYLREYYKLWEDYWTGEDIRKTAWYASVGNVYMQLGERNTHTYALKKGDMKKFRACMEKAVSLAETPEQKKRALVLMQVFEFSELATEVAFSEIMSPDGQIHSVEQARDLAAAIRTSMDARKKYSAHPLFQLASSKTIFNAADGTVGKLIPYLKDPQVWKTIEKLADDPAVSAPLRGQFKIWLGTKAVNLIENGSFEQDKPTMKPLWSPVLRGERDGKYASDGKYGFKTGNGYYIIRPKIERGKTYLFLCDVFIEKGSGEGRFQTKIGPARGSIPVNWFYTETIPSGGSWNTVCSVVSSDRKGVDNLHIQLWFQKFERNEPVWIDNLRLYCLDDLISTPKQPENPAKKGEDNMNLKKNKLATTVLAAAAAVVLAAGDLPKELEGTPKEEIKEVTQYIYGAKADDPEAPEKGKTVVLKLPANAKKYGGVGMGIYDKGHPDKQRVLAYSRHKIPDEKYHWYKIKRTRADAEFSGSNYGITVYFENWKIGARLPNTITGKYDCWVLVKAEGPLYVDGSTKENKVYLSRVLLVPIK